MRSFIMCIMGGLVGFFSSAGAQEKAGDMPPGTKRVTPDFSTPQKTYETYLRAILAKDLKTAIACHHFSGDKAAEAIDVAVGMWMTAHELNAAARSKFGPRGLAVLQEWKEGIFRSDCTREAIERTLRRVHAGKTEIDNHVATLHVKWAKNEPSPNDVFHFSGEGPLEQFRKVKGAWKIDLHAQTGLERPADFFEKGTWGVMFRDTLAIERAILPDILNGKLRTEDETIAAFEQRFAVLLDKYSPGWRKQAAREKAAASIKAPSATDLSTRGFGITSTGVPTVAVSERGVVYTFWHARGIEKRPTRSPLPLLPSELKLSLHSEPKWSVVPGVHVFSGGQWSEPGRLLAGLYNASIAYAWCEGENLHLLVVDETRERTFHVLYDSTAKVWNKKAELPYRLDSDYTAYRTVGKTVHTAFCLDGTFWYLAYDGREWSRAVRLDAGGRVTSGGRMTRLAVTEQGTAHVAWWALVEPDGKGHRHAVVKDGKVIYHPMRFSGAPIDTTNFDIGIDCKGRLMIAYKPDVPEKDPDARKIHVRYKTETGWTAAEKIDGQGERLFGDIVVIGNQRRTLVTWTQSESYPWRGGVLGSTFRRMAITDGEAWTAARWIARHPTLRGDGTPVSGSRLSACLDQNGGVHVVWGCCSYCLAANLNALPDEARKKAD